MVPSVWGQVCDRSMVGARAQFPLTQFAPGRQAGGPLRSPAAGWLLHRHVMALMTTTSLDRHDTISLIPVHPHLILPDHFPLYLLTP